MRVETEWRRALQRDLEALSEQFGTLPLSATRYLDTELLLTLVADHFASEDPNDAWALLTGHRFAAREALAPQARRALAIARLRLPAIFGKVQWQDRVARYRDAPAALRLYTLEPADKHAAGVSPPRNGRQPRVPARTRLLHNEAAYDFGRLAAMRAALDVPPAWQRRGPHFAVPGRYHFAVRRDRFEVEISRRIEAGAFEVMAQQRTIAAPGVPEATVSRQVDALQRAPVWSGVSGAAAATAGSTAAPARRQRQPWRVRFADLLRTAAWMEAHAPANSAAARPWRRLLQEMQLCVLGAHGSRALDPAEEITIDGVLHLAGMVGSGKSVLLSVLAVHCARELGWRVSVIHSDVATVLRDLAVFDALRTADLQALLAVPFIGRSTRATHLGRLHRAEALRAGPSLTRSHAGYRFLSTVCPLDGLRESSKPLPLGAEPCTDLISSGSADTTDGDEDGAEDSAITCDDEADHAASDHDYGTIAQERSADGDVGADLFDPLRTTAAAATGARAGAGTGALGRGLGIAGAGMPSGAAPGDEQQRCDCPFLPVCPQHASTHLMQRARIWLTTPASLLVGGTRQPLLPEAKRLIETVIGESDLVLVDEADLIQTQFDDRYAPMEVLVSRGSSWLDRLARQVPSQVYFAGRPLVGRAHDLDRWLAAHTNTQRAADCLYTWLRSAPDVRKWLGAEFFTGERLLHLIAKEFGTLPEAEITAWRFEQDRFTDDPLGMPGDDAPWWQAVYFNLVRNDPPAARETLVAWLARAMPSLARRGAAPADTIGTIGTTQGADKAGSQRQGRSLEWYADRLLVSLVVGVLDHSLQDLIAEWPSAARFLDVDQGDGGLFHTLPEDLVRLVPESAMGAILGFQYYDPNNTGDGELRFFRLRGIGRALLYHLHDALADSDGIAGPHTILASGTSWAPGSWRYHLHIPPTLLLLPTRHDETAHTVCSFDPQVDPQGGGMLSVSGTSALDDRLRHLKAMVHVLGGPRPFGKHSAFDAELEQLAENRRRILLVVGSYEEAEAVGEALALVRDDAERRDVLTLVPDAAGELEWRAPKGRLPRSLLEQLATQPATQAARFLVAPLRAIERGYNILTGDAAEDLSAPGTMGTTWAADGGSAAGSSDVRRVAAIGSVYFLVRPMPVPGDLHEMVQRMNAWALDRTAATPAADSLVGAAVALRNEAIGRFRNLLRRRQTYSMAALAVGARRNQEQRAEGEAEEREAGRVGRAAHQPGERAAAAPAAAGADVPAGAGSRVEEADQAEDQADFPDFHALLWTQFVLVWQCIGRLLRGGVAARVHFVDAQWAPHTALGDADTPSSSMLLGFREILTQALQHPDAAQRAVAHALYGSAAAAFATIEGLRAAADEENAECTR